MIKHNVSSFKYTGRLTCEYQ